MLGVVTACGCGAAQTAAPTARPDQTITVVDPGAEPRRVVRHELTAHASERVESRVKLRIDTAFTNTVLQTGHRLADLPTIVGVERVEVASVAPDGDAIVTAETEEIRALDDVVDPAVRKRVVAYIAAAKKSHASWRQAPSGRISDLVIAPGFTSEALTSSNAVDLIRESAVVFPDTAIGIGATWKVTSQLVSGLHWSRTATFRLKALTESTATVDLDIEAHAPSQALSVEPNASTKVTSATNHATAELTIPLHGLVATITGRGIGEGNLLIVRGHLRITSSIHTEIFWSTTPVPITGPSELTSTPLP